MLENEYLHVEVREKIGAYGVYCEHLNLPAVLLISSYRDTNAAGCLKAFKAAIERTSNGEFDEGILRRAIICYFQIIDSPKTPNSEAMEYAFKNITYDEIQKRRYLALQTTKEQLIEVSKRLLNESWYSYVFGSKSVSEVPEGFTVHSLE